MSLYFFYSYEMTVTPKTVWGFLVVLYMLPIFCINRLEYSFSPEHEEQEFLQNGGNHLQDYMGPYTRPQPNVCGSWNLISYHKPKLTS